MTPDRDFVSRLKEVAKPDDTIPSICRSGGRGAFALNLLAKAAFTPVYNVVGGIERYEVTDPDGVFLGQRLKNGWKNSGRPWIHKLVPLRMPLRRQRA